MRERISRWSVRVSGVHRDGVVPLDSGAARVLSGRVSWQVLRFGAPIAVGMGLQTTFNLVDAYLIARLDPGTAGPSLGAIGICDQLAALGTIVSYGLSIATSAIVSRRYGEGDVRATQRVAWQSLLMVLVVSVVFGLLGVFGAPLLIRSFVGAKGQVAELGIEYLRVIVGGSASIFLLLHLTTLQRALGSSKTPILMLLLANVINFVLAVLLVYGPGPAPDFCAWGPNVSRALGLPRMGLLGAAWATVLARMIVLVPLFVAVARRFRLFLRPSWSGFDASIVRSIWTVGWPSSAQLVVRILAMLFVHSLVARAYTDVHDQSATTALGIVFRLETMALFVALGWGSAAQTFVGQNLGARQPRRAEAAGWYAAAYAAVMMLALALVYARFGRQIVSFFDAAPAVVRFAERYLHDVGPSYVGLGAGIVLGASIQGAGATRQTLLLDSLVVFAFQVPASLLVVSAFRLGPERLWQVVAMTYVSFAVVYGATYRRGRFLRTVIA
jgi:putative MATE family efflux protein